LKRNVRIDVGESRVDKESECRWECTEYLCQTYNKEDSKHDFIKLKARQARRRANERLFGHCALAEVSPWELLFSIILDSKSLTENRPFSIE
jgi:hypothetical protein